MAAPPHRYRFPQARTCGFQSSGQAVSPHRYIHCSAKDLLGLINRFVEVENIPIILIADESKINDSVYSEFKEKVVFRSIRLEPDSKEAIESIIQHHPDNENEYDIFLNDTVLESITIFEESKTNNLRTFKSIIHDFERIYQLCMQLGVSVDDIKSMYFDFSCASYELKANRFVDSSYGRVYKNLHNNNDSVNGYNTDRGYRYIKDEKEDKSEYSKIKEVAYSLFDTSYYFSFVDEWLNKGIWNEDYVINELKRRFMNEEAEDYNFLTSDPFKLTNETIDNQLPAILNKAYNGELTREEIILLLSRLIFLLEIDYPFKIDIDYDKMNDGYCLREEKIRDGQLQEIYGHYFIEDERLDVLGPKGKDFYLSLADNELRLLSWKTRLEFLKWLETPDTYYGYSYAQSKSIVSFDDELYSKFLSVFISSNPSIKKNMIDVLKRMDFSYDQVSHREDIIVTIGNLEKLNTDIDEIQKNETDSIAIYVLEECKKAIVAKINDQKSKLR